MFNFQQFQRRRINFFKNLAHLDDECSGVEPEVDTLGVLALLGVAHHADLGG
jgi:hypothetical protein